MAKAKAKKEATTRPISGLQHRVLEKLIKKGEMTRTQLSEALDGAFIGSGMMGHLDPDLLEPNSLLARGLVKVSSYPNKETGTDGPNFYEVTAAGRKAYENYVAPAAKAAKSDKGGSKKTPAKKAATKKPAAAIKKATAKTQAKKSARKAPAASPTRKSPGAAPVAAPAPAPSPAPAPAAPANG